MGLIALIVLTEASNGLQFIEVYSESGDNRAQT